MKLLLSHPEGLIIPFGSAAYRIQQYPGDIDLLEDYTGCCSIDNVTKQFAKDLQGIVNRITSSRTHYYSEVKAGVDSRYKFDIGKLSNGKYIVNDDLYLHLEELSKQDLIEEADKLIIAFVAENSKYEKNSFNNYDIVNFLLRKYYILRWTAKEIKAGYKILEQNKKITLEEAVGMDSLIKIDEITLINGRFVEITNAFFLQIILDNGNKEIINTPGDIAITIPLDIEKLYFSDMYYSPFKAVKRMFAFCRYHEFVDIPVYRKILEKILPLISSGTSLIYQIKSELDAIIIILEKSSSIPKISIDKQIDSMKFRLSTVIEINQKTLIDINYQIDMINDTTAKEEKIELIENLQKLLKKIINYNTILYLQKVGLNPPPRDVLPPQAKYNWNIIRTPDSEPINPLKKISSDLGLGGSLWSGLHSDVHTNPYGGDYNLFDFY